jgi:hypothetical protein
MTCLQLPGFLWARSSAQGTRIETRRVSTAKPATRGHAGQPALLLESLILAQQFPAAGALLSALPALRDDALLLLYARRDPQPARPSSSPCRIAGISAAGRPCAVHMTSAPWRTNGPLARQNRQLCRALLCAQPATLCAQPPLTARFVHKLIFVFVYMSLPVRQREGWPAQAGHLVRALGGQRGAVARRDARGHAHLACSASQPLQCAPAHAAFRCACVGAAACMRCCICVCLKALTRPSVRP